MTKRIRTSEPGLRAIRDTGAFLPRVEARQVAAQLGARASLTLSEVLAPLNLLAVRQELHRRLRSSGGRPALSGATRRAKIPLSDQDWLKLEEMAAAISSPGFAPSPGQVAGALLALSVESVAAHSRKSAPRKARPPRR
jgi:hypothetical protein